MPQIRAPTQRRQYREDTKYEWISNMKITKSQLKQIIKEELENLIEADEAWVLRKSGKSDAKSFLQLAPASDQKKGNYKWGAKEGARSFKGENAKLRAEDEKKRLAEKGITVSVEKK